MRKWFKEVREKAGMTQEKIAQEVGVTRQFIGMIENDCANPCPDKAKAIAELLGFEWTLFYENIKTSA